MPLTRMIHDVHGNHICYTPEEVEEHEKNGWRKFEFKPMTGLAVVQGKKRGRKPKWQSQTTQS
jgi:hypothetical protein